MTGFGPHVQLHEIKAWLGPAVDQLTADEVRMVHTSALGYARDFPGVDNAQRRERGLIRVVQRLIGEDFTPAENTSHDGDTNNVVPGRIQVGDYIVIRTDADWRVMERLGSHRMLKKTFRTVEAAVKRAESMQRQDDLRGQR